MFDWLDSIRRSSPTARRRIAFAVSGTLTFAVFLVWFGVRSLPHTSVVGDKGPWSALVQSIDAFVDGSKERFSGVQESFNGLKADLEKVAELQDALATSTEPFDADGTTGADAMENKGAMPVSTEEPVGL
jgi:hypothetical protein